MEVKPSEQVRQSRYTEVSRDHSSEEVSVMEVERRVESLKLMSFFFRIVKANGKGYKTIEKPDESCVERKNEIIAKTLSLQRYPYGIKLTER